MAELQRVNPQTAKQTAVSFNTPDAARAQTARSEAASRALSLQEQGKQNIARSLHGLADSVEKFGGTVATVLANEAKQTMDLATRLDMQSYTLALGDAQRKAQQEMYSHTYGTPDEAIAAYRDALQKHVSEVDNLFFPADEEGRVPGNYFRYANVLGLTPDHPMLVQAKQQTEAAGVEYALKQWDQEDKANNVAIKKRVCETLISTGVKDKDVYYKVIKDTVGDQYISDDALWKMAEDCAEHGGVVVAGGEIGARIKDAPSVYRSEVEKRLANGEKFDNATGVAREDVKKVALKKIQQVIDNYFKEFGHSPAADKWAEDVLKKSDVEVTKLLKASEDEANKQRRANILDYISNPSSKDSAKIYDIDILGAYEAENTYKKDAERYGWKNVLMDGNKPVSVSRGSEAKVMMDSMIVTLAKRNYLSQEDFDEAAKVLREAAHLPPTMQAQVKDFFRKTLEDAVRTPKDIADVNKQNELAVADYMFKRGVNTDFQLVPQMDGEKKSMALALCSALKNVPEERRHIVLKTVFDSIQQGNWDKAHADRAFDDLMLMHEQLRAVPPQDWFEMFFGWHLARDATMPKDEEEEELKDETVEELAKKDRMELRNEAKK